MMKELLYWSLISDSMWSWRILFTESKCPSKWGKSGCDEELHLGLQPRWERDGGHHQPPDGPQGEGDEPQLVWRLQDLLPWPQGHVQDQDSDQWDGARTSSRHCRLHPEAGGGEAEEGEGRGSWQQKFPRQVLDVHRPRRSIHGHQWSRCPRRRKLVKTLCQIVPLFC